MNKQLIHNKKLARSLLDEDLIKFYNAEVVTIGEDYTITFKVPTIIDNLDVYPNAYYIGNHTHEVVEGDSVLVMQPNTSIQEFYYFRHPGTSDSSFTGLQFGDCIIDISGGSEIKITDGTANITMSSGVCTVENGANTITLDDSKIEITDGTSTIALNGPSGAQITFGSTPTPTAGFCSIPNCLFTGSPHTTNTMNNP